MKFVEEVVENVTSPPPGGNVAVQSSCVRVSVRARVVPLCVCRRGVEGMSPPL